MDDIPHGEYRAVARCRETRDGICHLCRKAAADYVAGRRAKQRALRAAREVALQRLVGTYPEVYEALVDAELRQVAS